MSVDCKVGLRHVGDTVCKLLEGFLGLGGEGCAVGGEEDTAVEGNLDGLETVDVNDRLDLGVLEFSEFFCLLVHLVTDNCTGATAYGSSDGRADCCTLAVTADKITDTCTDCSTCAGADKSAAGKIRHGAAALEEYQACEEDSSEFFHDTYWFKNSFNAVKLLNYSRISK